jgi:2-C-methyl-D-erythritol 4-phosphate cytidylyltransferase/2-C-methyl-D-erythritol 2,4-cyclodiphosphate synthase
MTTWTVIVAAGRGARFGGSKQFAWLGARRVVEWGVEAARSVSDGVVLVVGEADAEGQLATTVGVDAVVAGGATRSASVRAGLAAVPEDATIVVVHDAARPLASSSLFRSVIDRVEAGADAVVPAIDVIDTIRRRGGGVVDRTELVAVQTPQAFRAAALRRAHATGLDATDDAGLVEASGGEVAIVDGETTNLKITNPEDLVRAEALVGAAGPPAAPSVAVGQGFDVHRFSEDPSRRLVLGGVIFEGARGLEGHSDADVIAHACTDALLGAAGLGDIGELFPDTDPALAGADSLVLLAEAVRRVRATGWSPGNIDCSVVLEAPKLAPRRAEIQARLREVVGAPVTVKGKRAEGLGTLGRREGIACWAVAIVTRR